MDRAAVRAVGHCTVLEIGDSLGNDLGWGLARELGGERGLTLVQADRSSTGLVTTWFYDWPRHLAPFSAPGSGYFPLLSGQGRGIPSRARTMR